MLTLLGGEGSEGEEAGGVLKVFKILQIRKKLQLL